MVFSIQELRERIKFPESQEWSYSDFLATALSSFENLTGLKWGAAADGVIVSDRVKPFGDSHLIPAAGIASVSLVETKCRTGTEWETMETTDYTLNGRRLTYIGTGAGFLQQVRVTYTGGYDADTLAPGDVRMAILAEMRFLQIRLSSERVALRTQAGNGASSVFEEGLHAPYFLQIANAYAVSF